MAFSVTVSSIAVWLVSKEKRATCAEIYVALTASLHYISLLLGHHDSRSNSFLVIGIFNQRE